MYSLESGVAWTTELKNAFKQGITRASLIYRNTNYNEGNFLKEAELKDIRYVPNAGIIGQAVAKMLTIKMVNNEDSNLNFENGDIQFKIGAEYNGVTYYINYGNFIVNEPPENDDTNGIVKFVAYDYMIKFNKDYINRVVYPCSLKDLLLDICSQAGVTLGSTTFANENFVVEDNQFEGKQLRDVLQHIAKCAFSWARIGQDNKLYLDFEVNNNINETITIDDYKMDAFKKANEYYGPINKVTFADSDIKGQEISVQDDASIATYGEKEIIIYDNYFAYNIEKRQELIQAGTALFGLRYMPIQKLETIGLIYLDSNDILGIEDGNGTTFLTRNFSHTIKYNGMTSDDFETIGESENQRTYANANNSIAQNSRTEIIVDRAKKEITAVVEEVAGQNQKIAQVTQTVSELSSQISDIADITTSLETSTAKLQFENINQSEPVRIVIHPIGVNISKLYPNINLKPSENLTIKTRILRFQNTTTNETFDYELPDDLLYYDSENYDEFQLDYEAQTCIVNKKCKWNTDGTVGLLPSERTIEYEYPYIELTEGDYTVSLIKYSNGYLFARMMIKNYYTAQFATRAELNSDIRQTVDNINLSVGEKLTNYSTTTEMNSAIDVKANAITQSVSENYATKTALGNTETSLKSEIKSTAEAITTSVSETYVTNQSLEDNYSTTEQTATMISTTVSQTTKNNLETVTVEYALGTSTTTAPTSGWSTTAPTWQQGKYMWQRTKTKTADGTENTSNPTCIAGAKGQDGINGVSISSITEYYAVSSSNSSAPADSAFKTTMQTMTATNKYLWNYEVITYSNNNTQKTIKRVIGTYGDKGTDGTNGIGIKSVTNKYQVSTSNTTAPTTWKDTPQTMTATNKYLWNYEIITYSDNTTTTSTPAVIGVYGDKGQTGNTGKGVKAVVAQYYLSSSKTTQTGGSWAETQPAYKKDYYYWTRTKITWTDDTVTYTTPILVEEINSLNESVAKLELTTSGISTEVSKKVGYEELGTKIQQNYESIRIAWNKISEYIQFINAQLQIKNNDKKLLMTLGQYGQYFYNDDILTGIIGTGQYEGDNSQKSLDFRLNHSGRFMGWFQKSSSSQNTYYSVLYYTRANSFGQTNEGIYVDKPFYVKAPIYLKNKLYTNHDIYADCVIFLNDELNINRGIMTDSDGGRYNEIIFGDAVNEDFFRSNRVETNISGTLYVDGREVATNSSDARLKHDIYNSDINALDRIFEIKHRKFIWNEDNKEEQIGYIAQELENIDENYVIKSPQRNENGEVIDYIYQVNLLPILATATKAIQELKEEIDEIKEQQSKQQQFLEMLASKFDMQEEYNDIFAKETIKKSIKRAVKYDNINEQYNKPIQYSTNFKKAKNKVKDKDEDKTILAMNDNGEIYTVKEKDIKGGK